MAIDSRVESEAHLLSVIIEMIEIEITTASTRIQRIVGVEPSKDLG